MKLEGKKPEIECFILSTFQIYLKFTVIEEYIKLKMIKFKQAANKGFHLNWYFRLIL